MNQWNKMTGFLTLQIKCIKQPMLLLLALLVLLQLGSMYHNLGRLTYEATGYDYTSPVDEEESIYPAKRFSYAPSFQQMMEQSDYGTIFSWTFLLSFAILVRIPKKMRQGSNSYYTLRRLSLTSRQQYYLQILLHGLVVFFLVCMELLIVLFSYLMYKKMVPSDYQIYQELFQAYLNSDFLITLCPVLHPKLLIMDLALWLFLSVMSVQVRYFIRDNQPAGAMGIILLMMLVSSNLLFIAGEDPQIFLAYLLICFVNSVLFPYIMHRNNYRIKKLNLQKKRRML